MHIKRSCRCRLNFLLVEITKGVVVKNDNTFFYGYSGEIKNFFTMESTEYMESNPKRSLVKDFKLLSSITSTSFMVIFGFVFSDSNFLEECRLPTLK